MQHKSILFACGTSVNWELMNLVHSVFSDFRLLNSRWSDDCVIRKGCKINVEISSWLLENWLASTSLYYIPIRKQLSPTEQVLVFNTGRTVSRHQWSHGQSLELPRSPSHVLAPCDKVSKPAGEGWLSPQSPTGEHHAENCRMSYLHRGSCMWQTFVSVNSMKNTPLHQCTVLLARTY